MNRKQADRQVLKEAKGASHGMIDGTILRLTAPLDYCARWALLLILISAAPWPLSGLTLELAGVGRLRPQDVDHAISATAETVLFNDESLRARAVVSFSSMEERNSFSNSFYALVLQIREGTTSPWRDVHIYYSNKVAAVQTPGPASPVPVQHTAQTQLGGRTALSAAPPPGPFDSRSTVPTPTSPIERQSPAPKTGPPFPAPETTVPGLAFESPNLALPIGTRAIRAIARGSDGKDVESTPIRLEVRRAPAVLTLLAMGGTCTDPDANTSFKDLAEAGITRNTDKCAQKHVNPTFLADLTPMSSVNCNDPCNASCINFMKHLALRIIDTQALGNELDSIDDPGKHLCDHHTNPAGIRNRVVFGKWRNTEEEPVCSTPIKFDQIIDDFVAQGGRSLILIGQSQGGAKLAGMVRDHWRWGEDLTLELIVMWDGTSFDVVSFSGHPLIESMGVRKVGTRPKRVLSFFQYSNPVPFQNGAPLDPSERHASAEQHDLDGCFSHNGIARSQFVHARTVDVVKETLQAVRDRTRL
jgi:hypothetical protein